MTRARAPKAHEVDAARFDPRLVRAFAERSADDAWRTRGVCSRQDPDTFFPPPREAADAALALCRRCEVLGSCLAWALDAGDRYGVWGGTTPRERRAMTVVWRETYDEVKLTPTDLAEPVLADY
jgi:WhiB family transcriptional regulator, redox-sensing transcriptional regulator